MYNFNYVKKWHFEAFIYSKTVNGLGNLLTHSWNKNRCSLDTFTLSHAGNFIHIGLLTKTMLIWGCRNLTHDVSVMTRLSLPRVNVAAFNASIPVLLVVIGCTNKCYQVIRLIPHDIVRFAWMLGDLVWFGKLIFEFLIGKDLKWSSYFSLGKFAPL